MRGRGRSIRRRRTRTSGIFFQFSEHQRKNQGGEARERIDGSPTDRAAAIARETSTRKKAGDAPLPPEFLASASANESPELVRIGGRSPRSNAPLPRGVAPRDDAADADALRPLAARSRKSRGSAVDGYGVCDALGGAAGEETLHGGASSGDAFRVVVRFVVVVKSTSLPPRGASNRGAGGGELTSSRRARRLGCIAATSSASSAMSRRERARGGDADGPARRATSVCDPTPRLRVCLQLLEESTFETADRTTFTRS